MAPSVTRFFARARAGPAVGLRWRRQSDAPSAIGSTPRPDESHGGVSSECTALTGVSLAVAAGPEGRQGARARLGPGALAEYLSHGNGPGPPAGSSWSQVQQTPASVQDTTWVPYLHVYMGGHHDVHARLTASRPLAVRSACVHKSTMVAAALLALTIAQVTPELTDAEPIFSSVPTVSFDAPLDELARAACGSLADFGFFYLRDHGVDHNLIAAQFEMSKKLFALPQGTKENLTFSTKLDIGYSATQSLDDAGDALDEKEGFVLSNNGLITAEYDYALAKDVPLQGEQRWPPLGEAADAYRGTMEAYFKELMRVNKRLNEVLFHGLNIPNETRQELSSYPFAALKQMRYAPARSSHSLGAGAHTDWGSLTLLALDGTAGLEIEHKGRWLAVPPREGTLVVNCGDQLNFLTAGHLRSARHRVVLTDSSKERFSTAFFAYFDLTSTPEPVAHLASPNPPPRRPPGETSLDYFQYKLKSSMEGVKSPARTCTE